MQFILPSVVLSMVTMLRIESQLIGRPLYPTPSFTLVRAGGTPGNRDHIGTIWPLKQALQAVCRMKHFEKGAKPCMCWTRTYDSKLADAKLDLIRWFGESLHAIGPAWRGAHMAKSAELTEKYRIASLHRNDSPRLNVIVCVRVSTLFLYTDP